MAVKFRWTQTIVIEYEVNPDHYPAETWAAPEAMLEVDRQNFEKEPGMLLMTVDEGEEKITLVGEILLEEKSNAG